MNTQPIIERINSDFVKTYRNAAPFVGSGTFWDFCMQTIADPTLLDFIIKANDYLEVPPVKTLLAIYKKQQNPPANFSLKNDAKQIGALFGFVFQFCLGYNDYDRKSVGMLGIATAARFTKKGD